ncbi:MAG: glycosyltransferase, partial [Armatimonadota bacterium]|nr:glycosyltransferase [Armatimonadota bacterium]
TQSWIMPVYQLRAELSLPRGPNPLFDGQHSSALVLALFSSVLGEPQPDWPPQTRVTGFCFYDKKDETSIAPELAKFLDSGPPPIVFTLGSSAVFDARNFYRDSAEAARRLGRRAVLLIGKEENLPPEPLPEAIVAFDYAPYSEILPRTAAIVHQGGVGTTGQALRAGKPMLVMPFSHDQPDNAARITRLGVGRTLPRYRYNATRAAAELSKLLNDLSYATRAAEIGCRVQAADGPRAACDAIEERLRDSV